MAYQAGSLVIRPMNLKNTKQKKYLFIKERSKACGRWNHKDLEWQPGMGRQPG